MGQQASLSASAEMRGARISRAVPPFYTPLVECAKPSDPSAALSEEESKDAAQRMAEFGAMLEQLPPLDTRATMMPPVRSEHALQDALRPVDSLSELFEYVSRLVASWPSAAARLHTDSQSSVGSMDSRRAFGTTPSEFDMRVSSYVKNVQALYHLIKKEKLRYEQHVQAAKMQAASQRRVAPPPLPLPTQNCMNMGWALAVQLLNATRTSNTEHYLQALRMIQESLLPLKPTAYADSMYLAPSAAASFNMLCECLMEHANASANDDLNHASLGASTIETLAELGLARGSLATLLTVVLWLMKQPSPRRVDLSGCLTKMAALKEQPLYGKWESSGELFSCGQNSYGELGTGDDIERHQLTSVPLCGWNDIRQVVSGNELVAILTNGGVVLTCGLNKSGQCGHGHFDERVLLLRPVQALRSQRIKYISASNGCEHMIALTDTGLAYSWGYNDRGQLGHENLTTKIHLPRLIEAIKDKKSTFAAVSYHHSAIVTDTGELYTFGMNDCGQLGLDHTQHSATPQLVKALQGQEVSMVACGLYHTIACTSTGELVSFGKNDYGQLGLGHGRQVKVPSLVSLPNEMVSFVACGYYHSVVVTNSGHTYSFGRNDYGQLGVGTKLHQNVPTIVALSVNTRMVRGTCGCYHTVLLTEQGQVFVFGRNNKGQLGNRSSADSLLPVPLRVRPEKTSRRCIDIAAGFYTTSLIFERRRENEDGDSILGNQSNLVTVCGRVDIDASGEIEGLSNFGSVSTAGISLFHGKWYYEVEVVTSGLIQIGWVDAHFQGSSDQGEGVGDHLHSWSYDGNRQRRWNSGSSSYGEKWKAGDVIGCLLDLDDKQMCFYRNGVLLGVAFSDLDCSQADSYAGLMPGISLERGEIIRVNLGHRPFAYPPASVLDVDAVAKAILRPSSAATIESCISGNASEPSPPHTEGSAAVEIGDKVIRIGGGSIDQAGTVSEANNQVWVFHTDTAKWERWSDFPIAVRFHQAVAIDSDHVLVIGGENMTASSRHMDLYKCSFSRRPDGSLPSWELVQASIGAATSFPPPRSHHVASYLRVRLDGVVFLFGGKSTEDEPLGDVWVLSLEDYSWSRLPTSLSVDPGPRSDCASCVIGESVYIFGGQDKENKLRADLWRYNTFDRVWCLCHDDSIPTDLDAGDETARAEFASALPEARADYCIYADLGNIWVLGGRTQAGTMLADMWCFSIMTQQWLRVEVTCEKGFEGIYSAALVAPHGFPTALASPNELSVRPASRMIVIGGRAKIGGVEPTRCTTWTISAASAAKPADVNLAKTISTSGKWTQVQAALRAAVKDESSHSNLQCDLDAVASGVCVLSHLDRLAFDDIPADDMDSIQLSRCNYRSLCVDPNQKTFSVLHNMLELLSRKIDPNENAASIDEKILHGYYPLLVTIRLLKLNFFELSRSCTDPRDVGLPPESVEPGGNLYAIRHLLFRIADFESQSAPGGEEGWYCRAVNQEAASTIYHGFSILFPSLFDRMDVMNQLIQGTSDTSRTMSVQRLLVPMLVPYFASPKMLFQLMGEANGVLTMADQADVAAKAINTFMSTLLESMWMATTRAINAQVLDDAALMKALVDVHASNEFKCFNVLLRVCVYWCATCAIGWPIMESLMMKLVGCTERLLEACPTKAALPRILHQSFLGKFLPFAVISACSLPIVRENFSVAMNTLWPRLEALLLRLRTVLSERNCKSMTNEECTQANAKASDQEQQLLNSRYQLSDQMRTALALTPSEASYSLEAITNALWEKIVSCKPFSATRILSRESLYRVHLPADLAVLLCSSSFVVQIQNVKVGENDWWTQVGGANVSIVPSRLLLSQHMWKNEDGISVAMDRRPSEKVKAPNNSSREKDDDQDASELWVHDLQQTLAWFGSHYAAALVACDCDVTQLDARWVASPLLRGGLEHPRDVSVEATTPLEKEARVIRNDCLLREIITYTGAGKKIVDRVKHSLDPTAGPMGAISKLTASRLKRQDSVEAALEKSGGIEVVDRAVRVAFAVLLKHSNTSYVNDALLQDGTPSDTVIDAWRSALMLRKWIVREQQKLASNEQDSEQLSLETSSKDKSQSLYAAVCEPLIERGELLLQLSPAPTISGTPNNSPMKLLPGISAAAVYDFSRASNETTGDQTNQWTSEQAALQLKKLMATKTIEVIEEEDERVQSDIFSFLQWSRHAEYGGSNQENQVKPGMCEIVKNELLVHRQRAVNRLEGLKIFLRLLDDADNNASYRLLVIPAVSSAFKRLQQDFEVTGASAGHERTHYLEGLDLAGGMLTAAIRNEFFRLMAKLLCIGSANFQIISATYQAREEPACPPPSSAVLTSLHELLLILESCCLPFDDQDWDHVSKTDLPALVTGLTSWKGWQSTLQLQFSDDALTDTGLGGFTILPANANQRCPRIVCPRSVTIGTDLERLTISHRPTKPPGRQGGLAVFDNALYHGRWYWELVIVSQSNHAVFVGACNSFADMNALQGEGIFGVLVSAQPKTCGDQRSADNAVECSVGETLGVLLDCDNKKIEYFIGDKRVCIVNIKSSPAQSEALFLAVGVREAEVHWNLTAEVPPKVWAASSEFQFRAPVVSGCLVAMPLDGTTIACDAKRRGRHLRLSADGTTIIAGDSGTRIDDFATMVTNRVFEEDAIFVEINVLSGGQDGRTELTFGVVDASFTGFDARLTEGATLAIQFPDDAAKWCVFGVLFNFASGQISLYSSSSEPVCTSVDTSGLKKPLLPAFSALCNGTVLRLNFHPEARPGLPIAAFVQPVVSDNTRISSSNEVQIGRVLQMQVVSCDGGEFSTSHSVGNCLLDDHSVFSSTKGANVNLILKHEVDVPFCVGSISIRGPGPGYSSPVHRVLVFVMSSLPDLRCLQAYDSLSTEEFASLPFPVPSFRSHRDEMVPVAYFVLDGSCAQVTKQLAVPIVGRYIVVKLLCPSTGANIDVGYMSFCGTISKDNGPAYCENYVVQATCDECGVTCLRGVFYSSKEDETAKLCAACYDDGRGALDAAYFAHMMTDATDEAQGGESVVMCAPRISWLDSTLMEIGAKHLGASTIVEGTTRDGSGGALADRSVLWFDDCELFSCGQNNYGELCLGHCNSTNKLERVVSFSSKSVREIAGGNEVLAVLMKDGSLYTCGLNKSGQCGNGTFEERVLVATQVRALSGIPLDMIAAANGCEHMLAVGSDGAVYSWGYNDRGQLGLGSTISKSHTPRLIESLREKYSVTYAAVSYHHSAVVTSAGQLLTFGMNDCGQLGLDHLQHQHSPQLVDSLSTQVVTKVACGLYHTVVVTAAGELYSFGKNDYGQLGLGHARNAKVPTLVRVAIGDHDEKIVDVSCGYYHTVAISDKGKLITWGRNDYGQLGLGSKDHKNSPQSVPLPLSSRIRKASCGCYHTLVLLSNARVMVFGRNNKGQLGVGPRTLPSADLPLPIPCNSLSNDEVVAIAAGFYSSYVLTGRSNIASDDRPCNDGVEAAKDLCERSQSEALFESLMKEIDQQRGVNSSTTLGKMATARSTLVPRIPLLKAHAAAWAMLRALLYQSVQSLMSDKKQQQGRKTNAVVQTLVEFLLGNLQQLGPESSALSLNAAIPGAYSGRLKDACVGLLTFCSTEKYLTAVQQPSLGLLHAHFYRVQILWVLLACGSMSSETCAMISSNGVILKEIMNGIASPDLSLVIISIKLAMLVFPLHSVASVNAAFRASKLAVSTTARTDVLSMLILLIGRPLIARPRLCIHELGIECSTSKLCEISACMKGIECDAEVASVQADVMEKHRASVVQSAELINLVRYLMLYPAWRVAMNAMITRSFAKVDQIDQLVETVYAYYVHVAQHEQSSALSSVSDESGVDSPSTALRRAECTTKSSEEANVSPNMADTLRDKNALARWQKTKDAFESLASIAAAISIVGGHADSPREGALVMVQDPEQICHGRKGLIAGLKKDARGEIVAQVELIEREGSSWPTLQQRPSVTACIPLKCVRAIEQVPPLLAMTDNADSVLLSLSSLAVPSAGKSPICIDQPQNTAVEAALGRRMRMLKKQIQWRAVKGLGALLQQMPTIPSVVANIDAQLLINVAQLIASENTAKNTFTLNTLKPEDSPWTSSLVCALHQRWLSMKQRQVQLDTERLIDSSLDRSEASICEQVVRKLGEENALSWGSDAIQSPRRKAEMPSFSAGANVPSLPAKNQHRNETHPPGAWGVLRPLPQLSENEGNAPQPSTLPEQAPFWLTTPVVRVGRAADSCDLIVNDRSVSGRHFHLRYVRQEGENTEDVFELQDFSKNGTIVNGVRVHGTSVRLATGSRISLILSRGGLITYEFQARVLSLGPRTGFSRMPPPPIITAQQLQMDAPSPHVGQEYQASIGGVVEPRSPAEVQNRGSRHTSTGHRADGLRSRLPAAAQNLRLITSIAESEVPRALISPNPAVESPRVGGYNSPRSCVLQAPSTPAVASPTSAQLVSMGILSPASYQQHESSGRNDSQSERSNSTGGTADELQTAAGNLRGDVGASDMDECGQRLDSYDEQRGQEIANGQVERLNENEPRSADKILEFSPQAQHLSGVLGLDIVQCDAALQRSDNNMAAAVRLLLSGDITSPPPLDTFSTPIMSAGAVGTSGVTPTGFSERSAFISLQELMEENPSYALAESSAHAPPRPRPASPPRLRSPTVDKCARKSGFEQLNLWMESIAAVDASLQVMSINELENEEMNLSELLAALYSRTLMQQIVRLYGAVPEQVENAAAVFGDPSILRPLIAFPECPSVARDEDDVPDAKGECQLQRVLHRVTQDAFDSATTVQTMDTNLTAIDRVSILLRSIEERDVLACSHRRGVEMLMQMLLVNGSLSDALEQADPSGDALQLSTQQQTPSNAVLQSIIMDAILQILSRTLVHNSSVLNWESALPKLTRPELALPKGPIVLSCGIECLVVSTYERMWSVPSPNPLAQFRHKWRKRSASRGKCGASVSESCGLQDADNIVTIWRPSLPSGVKIGTKQWIALSDVIQAGCDAPMAPVLLVCDDGSERMLPPIGFERVDVTGQGLPRNSNLDVEMHRKQVRSVWWPIAPPGYVALGCVAGSKEDPLEPPPLVSVRCVREEFVERVEACHCMWRAETNAHQTCRDADGLGSDAMDESVVSTSLWCVEARLREGMMPVITVSSGNSDASSGAIAVMTAYALRLSSEDAILCSPVTVASVLGFVDAVLVGVRTLATSQTADKTTALQARPELPKAIFALLQQVMKENLPQSGQVAVRLVRTLIALLHNGAQWQDQRDLLYCRSKIMLLHQEQDGSMMLNALLQAFIELMLAVDEQRRKQQADELVACLDSTSKSIINMPYRFGFARDAHKEMLVSHCSKMTVTRHFAADERKFLLEYHTEDLSAAAVPPDAPAVIADAVSCRFECTPELRVTLDDHIKAEIVYFEIAVVEWESSVIDSGGSISLGFSPTEFPLEGVAVGLNAGSINTFSFTPANGRVQCPDGAADLWKWSDQLAGIATGDVFGCGFRVDREEIFFTKNGKLLGTAFSSVSSTATSMLHPTISVNADCKLLINFGANTAGSSDDAAASSSRMNFAFRFGAMDYDNVMAGFDWYEQLSQVYGVMKALLPAPSSDSDLDSAAETNALDSASAPLPNEFLLSADNFLSEISEDVCIRVETAHPYEMELQESVVNIPLATSIRVKLDASCETANAHCLQILQGGDTADSSESEVRAFTGVCGGQEVMIDGDGFVWRFPVHSNFQCRVDRIRKGPYLKLENHDTRLSLTRDKGWQTAIGVARFDSGLHVWEVRIAFATASSNIFLGVARRDVRLDSYLGKDNRGWGWIGNRALWHNGSKQRGTYGEKFKTGDLVRMTLDLRRGTLSYALNGKDLGVAFGPGGVGPKLEGTFYPGFALYNQRDSIDLVGGHRVEEGDLPPVDLIEASGEEAAAVVGEEDDTLADDADDTMIPNFRLEMATVLSQMGFPMEWCLYALRHCEDDAEQAADFILSNMHLMDALVREEAEQVSRRLRRREQLAALPSDLAGRVTALDSAASASSSEDMAIDTDAGTNTALAENAAENAGSGLTNPDKWGIAFTAVPEFSVTGRRLLAAKYSVKLRHLHASQAEFTRAHDCAIVQIVNDICEARAEALQSCDPLRMSIEEFVVSGAHARQFELLSAFSIDQLRKRFLILRNFNCRLQNSLAYIDFSIVDNDQSLLASGARHLRGLIFQQVKLAWWLNVLKEQQSPAAARPEIEVDRARAREATDTTSSLRESVFAQCFEQLHAVQPSLLRGADRAFKCQFVGEFGDDFGGLYRECLAQISSELQAKSLPLLLPSPNALNLVGENREVFVPNMHVRDNPRLVQMLEFLGKLVGIAVRTKTPLDLTLPAAFWKVVVHQRVQRRDISSINHECFQVVDTIANIANHGITESMFDEIIDATFTVLSSAKREVELVPGGRHVRVTWDDKDEYAHAVESFRLREFQPSCRILERGLATILPVPTLALFTWKEFATLVCGTATVDIDLLRRRTIYSDGCQASDPHIAFFWQVLTEFTDEQKSAFLRFVWGRSRLPTHAADFTQDFKISGLAKSQSRPDAYLPIAHTCFFSIDLPAYSTREIMHDKLLYAITQCPSIDADNTTVAQRAGQGLNWTMTGATPTAMGAPAAATLAMPPVASAAAAAATATATAAVNSVIAGLAGMAALMDA